MSEAFDKLKAILQEKQTLTTEDFETITKSHGVLSDQEHIALEAMRLRIDKQNRPKVSMEDYLKAAKVLDEVPEGSDEYKAAEEIVNAFEGGG